MDVSGSLLGCYHILMGAKQGGCRMMMGEQEAKPTDVFFVWDLGQGVRVTAGITNILEVFEAPEPGASSTRSGLDR